MRLKSMIKQIIIGVIISLVVSLCLCFIRFLRNVKDTKKIINYLKNSKEKTGYSFRSNHAIASDTHLTEERVRTLCSRSKKVKRNEKEKESWKLNE